jgi:hypothetical protein
MNTLDICKVWYKYEIDGVVQDEPAYQTDFIVDGKNLSKLFNFENHRPWFGLTEFESSNKSVNALKGLAPPVNQFDNGNFVLYRCHCGCDYCGVIACKIVRTSISVKWCNIYYGDEDGDYADDEEDQDDDDSIIVNVSNFEFSTIEYDSVIDAYQKKSLRKAE